MYEGMIGAEERSVSVNVSVEAGVRLEREEEEEIEDCLPSGRGWEGDFFFRGERA